MMIGYVVNKTEAMLKAHPNILIFVCMAAFISYYMSVARGDQTYALADQVESDFKSIHEQVEEVKNAVNELKSDISASSLRAEINTLEQQLRAVESEVFALERLESSGEATDRDINRLDMLKSDRVEINRILNNLYRQQ